MLLQWVVEKRDLKYAYGDEVASRHFTQKRAEKRAKKRNEEALRRKEPVIYLANPRS